MQDLTQVIRWLIQGISAQTKDERRFLEEHPLVHQTDDELLRRAVRILEAAQDVDKEESLSILKNMIEEYVESEAYPGAGSMQSDDPAGADDFRRACIPMRDLLMVLPE
jgi:hypothetical protein